MVFDDLTTVIVCPGVDWQSWKAFNQEAVPSVGILVFVLALLLYLSVTFLTWQRGAPWSKSQVLEYAGLSAVASAFIAAFFAALAALLWPAMQILGFSMQVQESIASFINFYFVVVIGVVAGLLLVVLLIWDNYAHQPRLGQYIAEWLDMWWVVEWYNPSLFLHRNIFDENLHKDRLTTDNSFTYKTRNRVSEGFHRTGIVFGGSLVIIALIFGIILNSIILWIAVGVVLCFLTYGFFRVLGWIVNGFLPGNRRRDSPDR